jgi:hypothetical protein
MPFGGGSRRAWAGRNDVVVDDGKPADTPCASSWNSLANPLRHGLSNPHLDRDRAYWTPHVCSWWGEMAQPVNWPHVAQKVSSMAVWLIAAFTHVERGTCPNGVDDGAGQAPFDVRAAAGWPLKSSNVRTRPGLSFCPSAG